jgi:hypothetical protein
MKIEFLFFKECPGYEPTLFLLEKTLLKSGIAAFIEKIEITTSESAIQNRFLGSPSIRINGIDIEGRENASEYGLKCRIYQDTGTGVPSEAMLRKALEGTPFLFYSKLSNDNAPACKVLLPEGSGTWPACRSAWSI